MTGTSEFRDPLTGAYSRLMFQQRFYEEAESAQRYASSLSILIIDIDHFKSINDAFGHTRGDEILMEFVERISTGIRAADILFRYGGDEFVILLPNTTRSQALNQANRLLEMIRPTQFAGEPPLSITVSIGLATYPEDTLDPRSLFDKADMRLLDGKSQGRNRVVHEEVRSRPDLLFDQSSRLVERDAAIDALHRFLDELVIKRRGVLTISGIPGSGCTRFMKEVRSVIEIRGAESMMIQGYSALKNRPYGAWAEARKLWRYHIPPYQSREDSCQSIDRVLREHGKDTLIILVDDLHDVDRATLEFLRFLQINTQLPTFGVIYTINTEASTRTIAMDVPFRDTIELGPVSRNGLKIWLRGILQWEPPDAFIDWLHRETMGLPAHVTRATTYLVKRGVLKKLPDEGWTFTRDITDVPLKDRVEIATKIPPHNLPSSLTGFVGRHPEILKLGRLIEEKRLISLVGHGGIGKTRLALRIGEEKIRYFQDGVFFVPLAPVEDPELIVTAIAEAIRLTFSGPQNPDVQLINYLLEKEMLLILDNFEHVVSHASIVARILDKCPDMRIVATSRERLNLMGEVIFEVTGLSYPPENMPYSPDDYSAIKMFVQCARRTYPPFLLTDENKLHIGRICRIIEGMPLGIELAAAWIRVLSCQEIADEIAKNLDFLSTSQWNVPERHRSIRAVFEHSWALLIPEEQATFRRLAIFRGGFSRDAALTVVDAPISILSALIDKSLLYRTFSHRYHVLEVLRHYIREKLDENPSEQNKVSKKHCTYFADYCQKALVLHREQKEKRFLTQISEEIDNIRVGWSASVSQDDIATLNLFLEPLALYYDANGMFHEGDELFRVASERLEAMSNEPENASEKDILAGKLYNRRGNFAFNLAQFDRAMELNQRSYDIFDRLGCLKEKALALNGLGGIASRVGDYTQAKEYHEQALAIRRTIGDQKGMAASLNNLANVVGSLGNMKLARDYYEQSLAIIREVGDRKGIAALLANLGIAAGALGERELERNLLQESLQIRKEMGDRGGIASALDNLGNIEQFLGSYSAAIQLHRDSLQIRREIGDQWGIALSLLNLANVNNVLQEHDSARRFFDESLAIYREIGDRWGIALNLNNYGGLLLAVGQDDRAEEMICESIALFTEIGDRWGCVLGKISLAFLAFKEKDLSKALQLLHEGMKAAIEIHSIPLVVEILVEIAQVFLHLSPPRLSDALAIIDLISHHPATSKDAMIKLDKLHKSAGEVSKESAGSTPSFENLDELLNWLLPTLPFANHA